MFDAHLKNFSLYESPQGDFILTPAYDLLNTAIHFPNEPTATGLDLYADGHFTARYEELGFYSSADFIALGQFFGVDEPEVRTLLHRFSQSAPTIQNAIKNSHLSAQAQAFYLSKFQDRLKALAQ